MQISTRAASPRRRGRDVIAARSTFYGWRLLAAFWLLLVVNLGFTLYGSGIVNTAMVEAEHYDARELGLAFSAFLLMLGLPAPLVAATLNRFGLRAALSIGTVLIAAGAFAMATVVNTPFAAALSFGLTLGTGVSFAGAITAQVAIGRWFVRRRALALSIMFSANGVGGLIAPPILSWVILWWGDWRAAWMLIGSLSLIAGIIALVVTREDPASVGQVPDGDDHAAAQPPQVHITGIDFTVRQAMATRAYWLVAAACGLNLVGFSLVLSHGVANLRSLGQSPTQAALAVSLLSGCSLAGKFLIGSLGDRIDPRTLWMAASLLIALGVFAASLADGTSALFAYAILFGLGIGGAVVLQSATLLNYFGIKPFASLMSLILLAQTGVSAAIPLVAGALEKQFGSYQPVFLIASGVALLAVPVLLTARPPQAPLKAG